MVEFLLAVALLIIGALGYACWNMLKKNERLEDAINVYHSGTLAAVRVMREIDSRQIFEGDDEVGTVFKQLLDSVNALDAFVTETVDGNRTTEEEK